MSNEVLLAYLAGCLDCDGTFGIKRSTYHMRVRGDAGQPVFSERIGFTQVKPEVAYLLEETFGGGIGQGKGYTKRAQPTFRWSVTDRQAAKCAKAVFPYLRIKHRQAKLLLELRKLKEIPRIKKGTFTMFNRWHVPVVMPRRIVDPEVIIAKEKLFQAIKNLNDIRIKQPQLIGKGLSGEEKRG